MSAPPWRGRCAWALLDSYLDTYNFPRDKAVICTVGTETVMKLQYVIAYPSDGYLSASASKCIDIMVENIHSVSSELKI